jgi:regulator of sigma E protease
VLGFGFVIFWHELGHFLAAKWVGIRVEQFAVGFGQAVFSWRKGIGIRAGNTQAEYKKRIDQYLANSKKAQLSSGSPVEFSDREYTQAADELGLGETEYRLNWIPLGGYVKMLGQDDLRPDAAADDPKAYNRKSISARMLVISAGVIMNVILAAIMFVVVFLIGLHASPAQVGSTPAQSPVQLAGLKVGDKIIKYNDGDEVDLTKITLDVALSKADTPVPITVLRDVDGKTETLDLQVIPRKPDGDKGLVQIGFTPPVYLKGPTKEEAEDLDLGGKPGVDFPKDEIAIMPGDIITAINGQSVREQDFVVLDRAVQQFGRPVELTIKSADGTEKKTAIQPHFDRFFAGPFNLAGMEPRATISLLAPESSAHGKLQTGDAVGSLTDANGKVLAHPTFEKLMEELHAEGASGKPFSMTIVRGGQTQNVSDVKATAPVGDQRGQRGLGAVLGFDETNLIVADIVPDSPAAKAGLHGGDQISAMNDQPLRNWFELHQVLAQAPPDSQVKVEFVRDGQKQVATIDLNSAQSQMVRNVRYRHDIALLAPYTIVRKASNPLIAVKWGVVETRDFILQFYVTIRRMVDGSIPVSQAMGPYGILRGGMKFAFRGIDWLLWFLAMISANLAVVNFLPIPVVDGGQFVFLILEKIKGKPLSPKAMAIAQYVGLAFLAAVVVFVTYHDIMRRY